MLFKFKLSVLNFCYVQQNFKSLLLGDCCSRRVCLYMYACVVFSDVCVKAEWVERVPLKDPPLP